MTDTLCAACGHAHRRHDPEDGNCEAHADVGLGRCPCDVFVAPEDARSELLRLRRELLNHQRRYDFCVKERRLARDGRREMHAEVERLRADLDALSTAVGQAVVASSLAAGETLADPIPHIIVSTVTRLRAEALSQRADNAPVRALAYADGRDDERAAVVAWLKKQRIYCTDSTGEPNAVTATYAHAAEAVERGEHRREETK
jgi:hypothetical protein